MVTVRREMTIEDLSHQPRTAREQVAVQKARGNARRGIDVPHLTKKTWWVCTLCDLPCNTRRVSSVFENQSVCCRAPLRIHGWAP